MSLVARRHHRLIDARRGNNRNLARFGASFNPFSLALELPTIFEIRLYYYSSRGP
jgi:hypothetical protein